MLSTGDFAMKPFYVPLIAVTLIAGCGGNLENEAAGASGSVLLACQGTRVTKDYVPTQFVLRAATNAETSWYKDYFEREMGAEGFFEYADAPGYFETPPATLSERPVTGNTLPHETYAVSYYYVDDSFSLHPMNMYFGNFPEPMRHNASGGVLHFPYTVYLTAPEHARYIVIRHHDSPWAWEYNTARGDWINGMDEVWYARPADSLTRVSNVEGPVEEAALSEWEVPALGGCSLQYAWRDGRDPVYGGAGSEVRLRDEQRQLEEETVAYRERSGSRLPHRSVYPNAPGMAQAANPQNKYFGFPLVGFSEDDAIDALKAGKIAKGWRDGKWRAPVL